VLYTFSGQHRVEVHQNAARRRSNSDELACKARAELLLLTSGDEEAPLPLLAMRLLLVEDAEINAPVSSTTNSPQLAPEISVSSND